MNNPTQRISAHALANQLAARAVTVIDVREPMEYAGGHIAGSLNVPLSRITQADLPQGPLVLVCQSGNRSARALHQLLQQGHPHQLSDLEGGFPTGSRPACRCASSRTPPYP
jgi:rhodanese-related sulfurtransferase